MIIHVQFINLGKIPVYLFLHLEGQLLQPILRNEIKEILLSTNKS
jgi:hypothetical protein